MRNRPTRLPQRNNVNLPAVENALHLDWRKPHAFCCANMEVRQDKIGAGSLSESGNDSCLQQEQTEVTENSEVAPAQERGVTPPGG